MTDQLNPEDPALTPEVLAIQQWIRDDAPISIKMIITPKLISALADRLQEARTEGRRSGEAVVVTDDIVREAMRDAWNEISSDTGCHPLDIERGAKGHLVFRANHWSDFTAARIRAILLRDDSTAHDAGWIAPPVEAKPAEGVREAVATPAEALERLDVADGLCRWACVSMTDKERYYREVGAFWDVVGFLRRLRDESALPEPVAWRYRWMDAMYGELSDWDVAPSRDAAVALAGKHGEVAPLYAHPATGTDELPGDVVRLVKALEPLRKAAGLYDDEPNAGARPAHGRGLITVGLLREIRAALAPFADRVGGEEETGQ